MDLPDGYAKNAIRKKFIEEGSPAEIPMMNGQTFTAYMVDAGVNTSNLGAQPLLIWASFEEAVLLIANCGGSAQRGNAINFRLGEVGLPFNSIEGHVAHVVYHKQVGESVFRRITPIAAILIWAGICRPIANGLILNGTEW